MSKTLVQSVYYSGAFDFSGPIGCRISKDTFLSCGEAQERNGLPCTPGNRPFDQFAWLKVVPDKSAGCFPAVAYPSSVWTPCYWYTGTNFLQSKAMQIGEASSEFQNRTDLNQVTELAASFTAPESSESKTVSSSNKDLLTPDGWSEGNRYNVGTLYYVDIIETVPNSTIGTGLMQVLGDVWFLQAKNTLSIFPDSDSDNQGSEFRLEWNYENESESDSTQTAANTVSTA